MSLIKKTIFFCLACCGLISYAQLEAKTLSLETGRWVIDRYRNVELDQFDYTYSIAGTDNESGTLQLTDGSLWQVSPMKNETVSFYKQSKPLLTDIDEHSVFELWQPEDTLIFHKVVNRNTVLAYNVTKDLLLDVLPISGPTEANALRISSVSNTNDVSYTYQWNNRTQSFQQYQHNKWRTVIVLNDGSVWEGGSSTPLVSWIVGDPIHVCKNTPWWSSNTHIFMNFKTGKNSAGSKPQFRRLGVWQAG